MFATRNLQLASNGHPGPRAEGLIDLGNMSSSGVAGEQCSMQFCPVCGTLLLVRVDPDTGLRWQCQACPYTNCPTKTRRVAQPLKQKQVDDVLGGEEAWANVDQTDLRCEQCGHGRAYYIQMQTRSADEPMTIFYKCAKCGKRSKE